MVSFDRQPSQSSLQALESILSAWYQLGFVRVNCRCGEIFNSVSAAVVGLKLLVSVEQVNGHVN